MYSPLLGTVRLSCISRCAFFNITLVGVYMTGPFVGRIVDAKGPRPLLIAAFIFLLSGYSGIRGIFDAGLGDATKLSKLHLVLLVVCSFITGVGAHAGMASAMNTTARTFPDHFVSPVRLPILLEYP
jgi:MFS family permease